MHRNNVLFVLTAVVLATATLPAQNRQDLQIQSDLRQLTEQVNRLQLTVNQLAEQIKAVNGRVNQAAETSVKTSANQQLSITQVTTAISTLRENLQDNTVRVSQLAQEFGSVRAGLRLLTDQLNSLVSLLQPPAVPPDAQAADGTVPPSTGSVTSPPALGSVSLPSSAASLYRSARNDYSSGKYNLAIEGFQELIDKYPTSPDAPDSQLHVGESLYQKGNCNQAISAYQKVVDNYQSSDSVPVALVMLGMCNNTLNRRAQATAFFNQVIEKYPDTPSAMLAKQRLDAMRR